MAVKVQRIETRTSDLSGEEAEGVRQVKFSLDGKAGKLDLTPGEIATIEGVLAPYFEAFEAVKAGNGGMDSDESEAKAIRAWGRDHGYDVSERGKLSASLKAAYYKAQTENDEVPDDVKVKASKR